MCFLCRSFGSTSTLSVLPEIIAYCTSSEIGSIAATSRVFQEGFQCMWRLHWHSSFKSHCCSCYGHFSLKVHRRCSRRFGAERSWSSVDEGDGREEDDFGGVMYAGVRQVHLTQLWHNIKQLHSLSRWWYLELFDSAVKDWMPVHGVCWCHKRGWWWACYSMLAIFSAHFSCSSMHELCVWVLRFAISAFIRSFSKTLQSVNVESLHQCAWSAREKHTAQLVHGALKSPRKGCHHKNLGSNKTVGAVARVGRCIGTLSHVLDQFDHKNLIDSGSSKYKKPRATKDITIVVEELVNMQAFYVQEGRRHQHYPKGKDLLESIPEKTY